MLSVAFRFVWFCGIKKALHFENCVGEPPVQFSLGRRVRRLVMGFLTNRPTGVFSVHVLLD